MTGIVAAFTGRLGGDPLSQCTSAGDLMLSFSVLVVDHLTRTGDPRQWVRVACFGETAEQLDGVLRRGDDVACEGRLVVKTYADAPDIEVYCWDVRVLPDPPAPTRRRRPRGEQIAAGT